MTNMKTIYDMHKQNWDLLAAMGKPNVAEAAKYFYTYADMERAIGYTASMAWLRTGWLRRAKIKRRSMCLRMRKAQICCWS